MAGVITGGTALNNAIPANPGFFCNLVWTAFSPCVTQNYLTAGQPLPPGAKLYPINFFQLNPYSSGQALTLLSDPGSEHYSGLQVQVKHPFGHGLNFMANYAYSHSMTNRYLGDYFQADGALVDYTTLRNPKLNAVPSPYDLRHVFKTYFYYDLPFGAGKMFGSGNAIVNKVIGGWTIGSVISAQVGRNFKLSGGQNTYNYWDGPIPALANGTPAGILNYVPDENDSGVVLNGLTVSQLQSKVGVYPGPTTMDNGVTVPVPSVPAVILPQNLFGTGGAVQPASTPGVLGNSIFLRGPKLFDVDLSVIKSIGIWERVKFNIYAEFLNAFNHPNFNFIDGYSFGTNNPAQYLPVNAGPFANGTVGQNGNRQIQFRLQMMF